MQKWYFSKDGKITGPLGLEEANKLIAKHPNIYAWNPSYPQWMPVANIEEFDTTHSIPAPPVDVPESLYEEFVAEERELLESLSRIESTLSSTLTSLGEMNIDTYVQKTQNLNEEVKVAISRVEEQMAALEKSIADAAQS